MKETFAGKIRQAARILGGRQMGFSASELGDVAGIQSYEEKRRMRRTICDLIKSGELARFSRGVYVYKEKSTGKPQKQTVMLELLKMRRTVSVEDLQELAEVSADYAQEWLTMLVRRQVVKRHENGNYTLIKDPDEPPLNEEKAERLRQLRVRKKASALEQLKKIKDALVLAEAAIMDIE